MSRNIMILIALIVAALGYYMYKQKMGGGGSPASA